MTETQRLIRRQYEAARKQRHRDVAEETTANIIATTVVPYDPLGARRFAELDAALREGRA